ncbi:MAG: rhodanese-like domain-containing protein [Thermoanaerobaculia bacterium]
MARKPSSRSSPSVMPVMIVGAIIVVALLTWSLRRVATSRNTAPPQPSTTAASTAAAEQPNPELATVPRIKPEELRDKIARNEVTVIDVRDIQSYLSAHIPGALHIPMARLDGEVPYLPKDKPIVTYCT